MPFSIGIAGRPYNSVSTTVLHCDDCDLSNVAYVRTKQQSDPTLRGCFKLAKMHAAYAFPFVAIFAIGMLLNVKMFWPLKVAIAICYYFIWQYLNSRVLDYQVRLKIPIAWYLATEFWIYYTWFLYFWPYICTAETLVPFLFNTICLTYCFWNAYQCDPSHPHVSRGKTTGDT